MAARSQPPAILATSLAGGNSARIFATDRWTCASSGAVWPRRRLAAPRQASWPDGVSIDIQYISVPSSYSSMETGHIRLLAAAFPPGDDSSRRQVRRSCSSVAHVFHVAVKKVIRQSGFTSSRAQPAPASSGGSRCITRRSTIFWAVRDAALLGFFLSA